MGLTSLNAALAGLRVSQLQINTISTNIANAGTPGYSRKILPQSSQAVNGVTISVRPETIIRNVDITLQRDLWTQTSASSALGIKATYLNRIGEFHGPPDRELSVASEITQLRDAFSALSDNPADTFLLASTVNQAEDTATKINDLSNFITRLRNDTQDEITDTVNRINDLLVQVADLNAQIKGNLNVDRSVAQLADERDNAIEELSGLIDISFFTRGDGVLVVQTNEGVEIASDRTTPLTFDPSSLSATTFYPTSAAGIFVGNSTDPGAVDLTTRAPGGKLGGLIELRDTTFPKQMAQLDELAHKMALRFEAQGLQLFTNSAGTIPSDDPPDLTVDPVVAVAYVGFSAEIQVNSSIIADNSLIQTGTYGASVQAGSNEVIRRVIEYTFGNVDFQEAIGAIDLRVSGFVAPNDTLQNYLGIVSENTVEGITDLSAYANVSDLLTAGGASIFGSGASETDEFTIVFFDADLGEPARTITVDLSVVAALPPGGVSAAQDIVDYIMADANWANVVAEYNADVSVGANGQLVFESRGDMSFAASGVDPLSDLGFAFLGLTAGTFEATDPYFDVQVGNSDPVRITIEPADTEVELLAKLAAVTGLAIDTDAMLVTGDGFLRLRPGSDYTNPDFGGDIRIVGGPFQTSNSGVGAGTIPDDINIVSALFASFNAGVPPQDVSPISDTLYQSETQDSSATFVPFREDFLGPGGNISTRVDGSRALIDFAQKMVNEHTQELILAENQIEDEETLRQILKTQIQNESGVNIDEELGNLIVQQTAYSASARVITAISDLFQELLNVV